VVGEGRLAGTLGMLFRFLWHVSRTNLKLVPTDPDRSAGLAFLCKSAYALGLILFAGARYTRRFVARPVLVQGENAVFSSYSLGACSLFRPCHSWSNLDAYSRMARAKRKGPADYGLLAQHRVESPRSCRYPVACRSRQQLCLAAQHAFAALRGRNPSFFLASPAHDFLPSGTHHAHHQGCFKRIESAT